MKIRNILSFCLASSLLFASCAKEVGTDSFDNIKLDKTFLSIPTDGGSASVKITATEEWHLLSPDTDYWKDSETWVAPSDTTGTAGESTLTFTSEKGESREVTLKITCGGNTQYLVVRQGELAAVPVSVKDIIDGKVAQGKTVIVSGTCTNIYNTTYGNWYLNDGTGELTIYGTLNAEGKTKDFESLGIEVGDVVTVSGPYVLYGTTHELTDVTVLEIKKALLTVESEAAVVQKDGDKLEVKVSYKGDNFQYSVPTEYEDWISVTGINVHEGQATKIEPNPADTAYVSIKVAANAGEEVRKGEVKFISTSTDANGKKSSTEATYSISQKGGVANVTVAEFLAAEVSDNDYRLTGKIESIVDAESGKLYLQDATGRVYIYKITDYSKLGLRQGDIITIVGKRARYANASVEDQKEEMTGANLEESIKSTDVTVSEFLSKEVSSTYLTSPYYRLTGTIKQIVKAEYGNIYLQQESSEDYVYVYGLTAAPVAKNDKSFESLGLKAGDKITIVGQRGQYSKSKVEDQKEEVLNAYFVSAAE